MERDLTWGSVTRNLISFTLPIFASNLLQAMYGTVDMVVTGRFADASALSAVSTGSMTMQSVTGIIVGLTTGCTVLLGQRIGAGDRKSATRTIVSAFMIFILLGIAGAAVMFFSAPFVAGVMNAPPEAFSSTVSYLRQYEVTS